MSLYVPASPFYQDPLTEPSLCSEDLEEHVTTLLSFKQLLSSAQRQRLLMGLREPGEEVVAASYGADFDLASEVQAQITAVQAIRQHVLDEGGQVRDGVSTREVREVVTSGATLLSSLMKFHATVVNMDRMRSLERAVIDVLKESDPKLCAQVVEKLEERLESLH